MKQEQGFYYNIDPTHISSMRQAANAIAEVLGGVNRIVQQGGHNETRCNGNYHVHITGSAVGFAPVQLPGKSFYDEIQFCGPCNCEEK